MNESKLATLRLSTTQSPYGHTLESLSVSSPNLQTPHTEVHTSVETPLGVLRFGARRERGDRGKGGRQPRGRLRERLKRRRRHEWRGAIHPIRQDRRERRHRHVGSHLVPPRRVNQLAPNIYDTKSKTNQTETTVRFGRRPPQRRPQSFAPDSAEAPCSGRLPRGFSRRFAANPPLRTSSLGWSRSLATRGVNLETE